MSMMAIKNFRSYLETAVRFKEQTESMEYQLSLIEKQLQDILSSTDLELLPEEVQADLVIQRVRALRYWNVQLDDYKDKNLIALINAVKNMKGSLLDVTLEEAKNYFQVSNATTEVEEAKRLAVKAAKKTIEEIPEEVPEEVLLVSEEEIVSISEEKEVSSANPKSDDDILRDLLASQKS